jgi:hypothetical protein
MNYYEILEVSRDASPEDIKAAYRRLSRQWHPDRNLENTEEATRKFQDISNAYEHLRDARKRRQYDEFLSRNPSPEQQSRFQANEPDADANGMFFEEFKDIFVCVLQELSAQGGGSNVSTISKTTSAVGWGTAGAVSGAVVGTILFAPAVIPLAAVMMGLGAVKGWTGHDVATVYSNLSPELKQKVMNMVLNAVRT